MKYIKVESGGSVTVVSGDGERYHRPYSEEQQWNHQVQPTQMTLLHILWSYLFCSGETIHLEFDDLYLYCRYSRYEEEL